MKNALLYSTLLLASALCTQLPAQETETPSPQVDVETVSVPITLVNKSWFTDRVGTAIIHFDSIVDQPELLPDSEYPLSFVDLEVRETPDSQKGKSAAIVRFIVRETGIATIPSIAFASEGKTYRSKAQQIQVGEPVKSADMSIRLTAEKRQVYVGEPIRIDFEWQCDLEAGRLQALNYYPQFFNDPKIEIVIPRNTDEEDDQVGIPIGGRRVIATRQLDDSDAQKLGTVSLPIYVRLKEPGAYTLPGTRLECAHLSKSTRKFGQYAAHFNNELFSAENPENEYQRLYVETPPIEFEVLPLPEQGRLPEFSGIFTPVDIKTEINPQALAVGDLMEVKIDVTTDAPYGMVEFPQLSRQKGLRGRFLVDDQLGELWKEGGTVFRTRLRALTTEVSAFPTLSIQVFNTETGEYEIISTAPSLLKVHPKDGSNFIDISNYAGTQVSLVEQPEGIWHNLEANVMNDLLNKLVLGLASWSWFFILLGPVAFVALLPMIREQRKRAQNLRYKAKIEAYSNFEKLPENTAEKWQAFVDFLAISFNSENKSWTVQDSVDALKSIGIDEQDIAQITAMHTAADAHDFHPEHPTAKKSALNSIGNRILELLKKSVLLLALSLLLGVHDAEASDWQEAQTLFDQANATQVGSESAMALYTEAALKYQAAAEAGERPGESWYNAGNAWFKKGLLGRSIAAYRHARIYRPFDPHVQANLEVARALTLNDLPAEELKWATWPSPWLKALFVVISLIFWALLLLYIRYRKRSLLISSLLFGFFGLCNLFLFINANNNTGRFGVIVTSETYARKGPAYSYTKAFYEPLHDGLEFTLSEVRGEWALIVLPDGRECWVVHDQIQLLKW